MKKITFSFKSLLLAAGLLLGSANAWGEAGDVTTNANISFSSAETSNDVVLENSVFNGTVNSITIGQGQFRVSQAGWLSLDDATSTITIPEAQRAGAKDVVRVQFKRAWGNKNGMGSGISLKDAEGEVIFNFTHARWGGGSNNANIVMDGLLGAQTGNAPIKERYTLFDITIDYQARTITSTVECVNTDGKGTHKTETFNATLTNTDPIATFNAWGYNVGGNKDRADIINDIVITTTEGDYSVDEYDYTVNWQCGEDVVKTAIRQGEADADIELSESDDDPFWVSTKKYYYVSSDVAGKKVSSDGSTVVTITVREANTYSYSVKSSIGTTIISSTGIEGESISYKYPQYILSGTDLYEGPKQASNPWYGKTFTLTSDEQEETLTYTKSKENVVYYSEAENIEGATERTGGNADIRCSNGAGGSFASDAVVTTLPAGRYTVTGQVWGNASVTFNIYAGEDNVWSLTTVGYITSTTSDEFLLTANTDVVIKAAGDGGKMLDWVYIQRTGDATVPVTISSSIGVATLYTPYALNFSGVAGLKAYTAEVSGDEVVVTEVSNVPANTGVILKGAVKSYDIPVIASSSTEKGDLTGNAVDATAYNAFDGFDIYVLALNASGDAQFQKTNEGFVAAGKAFLKISNTNPVKAFRVVDGTATGVEAPEVAEAEEEEEILYNTAGVRVGKDYKGIVINQKGEKRLQK